MLTSKKMTLMPVLESNQGIHLTAYLENRGNHLDLKAQLRQTISQAGDCLQTVMSPEELNKFLEPLNSLVVDSRILREIKANIGIFRNQESLRVLNIPVNVEQMCHVASSFHVKPLLRWLQVDQEFLLLGLENDAAHLYFGSQDSLRLVDSVLYPEALSKKFSEEVDSGFRPTRKERELASETFAWINDWILQLSKTSRPKLFVAGKKPLVEAMFRKLQYRRAAKMPIANSFSKSALSEITASVRKLLKAESRAALEKSLMEFRFAEEENRTRKNIFQIAKAAAEGRVRKLIVSEEVNIFGKFDRKSGGLVLHPFDLDHEDDDVLDDLAQTVLSQGKEVVIASRHEIPRGRPILAILDNEDKELMVSSPIMGERAL